MSALWQAGPAEGTACISNACTCNDQFASPLTSTRSAECLWTSSMRAMVVSYLSGRYIGLVMTKTSSGKESASEEAS